jgi:ferric iron reductase protein FhuF
MYSRKSATIQTLAQTLTDVALLDENLIASIGPVEPDWFHAAILLDAQSPLLQIVLDRQAANHPHTEARTKASFFIGEYAWYVAASAVGAYLVDKRVPDLSIENVALRFQRYTWHEGDESGEADRIEVRYRSTRCVALPDDSLAADPDMLTLPDAAALREWMRQALEAHMTPLIDRVSAETRLSRHALWLVVADTCAGLFLHLGKQLGRQDEAMHEGLAFIRASASPMNNPKTGYITIESNGHCETFRARGGCCRYYTVSETADSYCSTCVLRKPEERDERLRQYIAQKIARQEILV